jgi:protein subunit release factor B
MGIFNRNTIKHRDLLSRMHGCGVYEKDLREVFTHSSGPGGQNVNKVATCAFLEHLPTGISIKCQEERTQMANRLLAREMLVTKIIAKLDQNKRDSIAAKEKIRRQKRKRSKAGKEKMLANKRHRSETKMLRKKVDLRKGTNGF